MTYTTSFHAHTLHWRSANSFLDTWADSSFVCSSEFFKFSTDLEELVPRESFTFSDPENLMESSDTFQLESPKTFWTKCGLPCLTGETFADLEASAAFVAAGACGSVGDFSNGLAAPATYEWLCWIRTIWIIIMVYRSLKPLGSDQVQRRLICLEGAGPDSTTLS